MSLYKTKFKNVLSEKAAMQTYKWNFFTIENQEVGNLGMSAKIIGLRTYVYSALDNLYTISHAMECF